MPMVLREGPAGRYRVAAAAASVRPQAVEQSSSAPAQGLSAYRARLLPRVVVCLVVGLVLPGWPSRGELPQPGMEETFVPAASSVGLRASRLRGTADNRVPRRAEAEDDSEAELRAKVAELTRKLQEKEDAANQAEAAAAPVEEEVNEVVLKAYQAVVEALPELEKVDNARLGMVAEKQYVFQAGDASGPRNNPIYKRKYEVMGMTMVQQETYMNAFTRAVKVAKKDAAVTEMIKLWKEGGGGLDRKGVRMEVNKLTKTDRIARLFFRDMIPEILDDPIADSIGGLAATAALLAVSFALCICLFPPIPPDIE